MNDTEILKKWINDKENIAFWGASEFAQDLIRNLIDKYPELVPVCVYDNKISIDSIKVNNTDVPVRNFQEYIQSAATHKIVLFINSRESYYAVRGYLTEAGLEIQKDFIDGFECGCGIYIEKKGDESSPYESLKPEANYAPWRKDIEFLSVYNRIKEYSLVDIYRCHELWQMVTQTKKCGAGDILEIGVYKGGTGGLIATAAEYAGIEADIYLCDTFKGVVKTTEKDNRYKGGEHSDTSEEGVKKLLENLGLNKVEIIKGIFPEEVSDIFDKKTYRFVHIDVDAYQSAKDIFFYVWKSVEHGGIVVFDDYGFWVTQGVTALLEELKDQLEDGMFITNLNGHGGFVKI